MRGNVDASRKHGPFDTRWPCLLRDSSDRVPSAPLLHAAEGAEALDWDAFSARHFRGRRRHDSEARSAYAAYTQGREGRDSGVPKPAGLSLVPSDPPSHAIETESEEAGTRRLLAAVAAVQPPEREGGSAPQIRRAKEGT